MTEITKITNSEGIGPGKHDPPTTDQEGFPKNAVIDIQEEMIDLYHSIDSLLSEKEKKSIQFIGSREGEGTSTLIREFARVSAVTFGKSVLLLNADSPKNNSILTVEEQEGNLISSIENEISMEQPFSQDGGYRLSVCSVSRLGFSLPILFTSSYFSRFIDKLKQQFDFILIDSPSAGSSSDGMAIARKVDGVVIVVEAEATRWPVVESVKQKIKKVGGHILGVILNKQRYYIPPFIYKRL